MSFISLLFQTFQSLTLSSLKLPSSSSSTKAANCCRIILDLVVDEDDLKWVGNEKNISLLLKHFHEYFRAKTPSFKDFFHFSKKMENDALMHREGLKG